MEKLKMDGAFTYPQALSCLTNTPLLVSPAKAEVLLNVLHDRASWDMVLNVGTFGATPAELDAAMQPVQGGNIAPRLFRANWLDGKLFPEIDGIAIIRVRGSLVQRNGLEPSSGMTGYDGLALKLEAALNDDSICGILFDIDSCGGQVSGCFDLADAIYKARDEKPIWAVCTETALSAAYAIASQCDQVILPRTGSVGSVGVVMMHVDYSDRLKNEGINITLIHAGAHKVDGHPYSALPEDVAEDLQDAVEETRTLFAETVARGRGIFVDAVLDTEARCLSAEEAMDVGFADAIMAPDDGLTAFIEALN